MMQSIQFSEDTELFINRPCRQILVVDFPPLPGWVTIRNIYDDHSIIIDESEWRAFVELINAVDIRIRERHGFAS